jgi:hypothetical protein
MSGPPTCPPFRVSRPKGDPTAGRIGHGLAIPVPSTGSAWRFNRRTRDDRALPAHPTFR